MAKGVRIESVSFICSSPDKCGLEEVVCTYESDLSDVTNALPC